MGAWQNDTGKYVLYEFDLPICRPRSIFVLLLFTRERGKNHPRIILQSFLTQNDGNFALGSKNKSLAVLIHKPCFR